MFGRSLKSDKSTLVRSLSLKRTTCTEVFNNFNLPFIVSSVRDNEGRDRDWIRKKYRPSGGMFGGSLNIFLLDEDRDSDWI